MKLNKYLIIIGSNTDKETSIRLAAEKLSLLPGDIIWGETTETEPVNMPNDITFLNRCLIMFSGMGLEEMTSACKEIERMAGRKPEDKKQGKVILDIDIVVANGTVLKPNDLKREYAKEIAGKYFGTACENNTL